VIFCPRKSFFPRKFLPLKYHRSIAVIQPLQHTSLRCIVTGLTAKENDGINCDDVESVGLEIQESIDNLTFNKAVVKRSLKVKTLALLKPGVKINNENVVINPTILFQRLVIVIEKTDDMTIIIPI